MVPQNRFGDLVEALVEVTLRFEKSTTTMYQSRQESKRSAQSTSQQRSGHSSRKRRMSRGYRGRGAGRGAASSQGSVRPLAASSDTQSISPVCDMCRKRHLGECKRYSTRSFHYGQEGYFIKDSLKLIGVETSVASPATPAPKMSTQRP